MGSLNLADKTVMISGACGALGRGMATRLLGCGARVIAIDIIDPAESRSELPSELTFYRCDTADEMEVAAVFDALGDHLPNVVCCHAGIVGNTPAASYPVAEFDALMRVNVRGAFVLAQEAARRWKDRDVAGHLIFTSSWVQDVPWPEITPYAASKAAVRSMMRGFARELAPYRIRANAVAPGIVAAGMALKSWEEDPHYRALASRAIPLGHMQPVESVADAFAFLCSDMASYMTGSVLLVDGGCSLYPMD